MKQEYLYYIPVSHNLCCPGNGFITSREICFRNCNSNYSAIILCQVSSYENDYYWHTKA